MWRAVPLAGVILLGGIAGVWRPWLQHRRHGTWGIALFRSYRPAHVIGDALLVLLGLVLFAQALVETWMPGRLSLLLDGTALEAARWCGAAAMAGGLALLVAAQLDLDASWRIGIDDHATPGLVTSGRYRLTRNPIYLGLLTFIAGYALVLLTWVSAILLVAVAVGIRRQALLEEDYLRRIYGESYGAYARRVGRFVPGIGRLD